MAEISKPDFQYVWASGGSIVAPSNVKIQTGWTAEVPPFQWENWSQNRQDQAIAHVLQHGISVWDAVTEYQAGKSYVQGSDGLLYKARTTHNGQDPVLDVARTYWNPTASGGLAGQQVFGLAGAGGTSTYTPTVGTRFIVVKVCGGGGGGGGSAATTTGQFAAGGGGGGGGYAESRINSGFAGLTVTVGVGGTGGAAGVAGANGGSSSFGSLLTATGGIGGRGGIAATPPGLTAGGSAGEGSLGNIVNSAGFFGGNSAAMSVANAASGEGGGTFFGGGAAPTGSGAPGVGVSATTHGGGGGGALTLSSAAGATGGAGRAGIVIITEYF